MFMAQALSADGSCRQVVDDAAVKRLIAGMTPCSSNTAAYCKARARLPQAMIDTLARRTGKLVADGVCDAWLWRGRRVLLADGTTVTLADTADNQEVYPQMASQHEGLGFPIMRLVGLLLWQAAPCSMPPAGRAWARAVMSRPCSEVVAPEECITHCICL